jgi:hypothetical protein
MSPRDRWLITACHIGLVVSILWTILYAGQIGMIVIDGARSVPRTPMFEQFQTCRQSIPATVLGVVMTIICVRVPETIKKAYRTKPSGFQVRPRRS